MSKVHLTLACGDYEIVRALMDGSVKPDGIDLTVLTDMTSDIRHWRMIRNREFDVAELSMSSYLLAKFMAQLSSPSRFFSIAGSATASSLSIATREFRSPQT